MPLCAVGSPAVTVQLLFGRSIEGGGRVDATAWKAFLDQTVTPRFPDGLTVLEGSGQWRRGDSGIIGSEPSTVVLIVTGDRPEIYARLDAIRAAYRQRFRQESVGLVVNRSCADF